MLRRATSASQHLCLSSGGCKVVPLTQLRCCRPGQVCCLSGRGPQRVEGDRGLPRLQRAPVRLQRHEVRHEELPPHRALRWPPRARRLLEPLRCPSGVCLHTMLCTGYAAACIGLQHVHLRTVLSVFAAYISVETCERTAKTLKWAAGHFWDLACHMS